MRTLVVAVVVAAACGSPISSDDVTSIDDYASWPRQVVATGELTGHGTSYRPIFANDVAETYTGTGLYAVGTIIVKEIRELESGDTAGDLNYIAVMRKLEEAPPGGDLDAGWLFTSLPSLGKGETNTGRCFRTCHQAAPFDSAFLDWSSARR